MSHGPSHPVWDHFEPFSIASVRFRFNVINRQQDRTCSFHQKKTYSGDHHRGRSYRSHVTYGPSRPVWHHFEPFSIASVRFRFNVINRQQDRTCSFHEKKTCSGDHHRGHSYRSHVTHGPSGPVWDHFEPVLIALVRFRFNVINR